MYSIMEAIEAAQRRTEERDAMNAQRQIPVLPIVPTGVGGNAIQFNTMGENPSMEDTRTEIEKYNDLVEANRYIPYAPVIGTGLGLLTDRSIQKMEEANPSLRPENPFSAKARERFSHAGRALGYGYPQQEGKYHTTLWDRITGVDPTWAESLARVDQGARNYNLDSGGGSDSWETSGDSGGGMTNYGGRESSVDDNDYSGYA